MSGCGNSPSAYPGGCKLRVLGAYIWTCQDCLALTSNHIAFISPTHGESPTFLVPCERQMPVRNQNLTLYHAHKFPLDFSPQKQNGLPSMKIFLFIGRRPFDFVYRRVSLFPPKKRDGFDMPREYEIDSVKSALREYGESTRLRKRKRSDLLRALSSCLDSIIILKATSFDEHHLL